MEIGLKLGLAWGLAVKVRSRRTLERRGLELGILGLGFGGNEEEDIIKEQSAIVVLSYNALSSNMHH